MLPEYEVELLTATLAEWRQQIAADTETVEVREPVTEGPSLWERLYSLFRHDPTQLPAADQRAALRMEGHFSR